MKRLIVLLFSVHALSACVTPPNYEITAVFSEPHAQELLKPGTNTIKGNAFFRQRGGGVVSCAGNVVYLIPATEYAKQRINFIYRSSNFSSFTSYGKISPDVGAYHSHIRHGQCDASGNFIFDRVADGEFFVTTSISWEVGRDIQGGNLMHRVNVKNGETSSVIMTR